jgi:hypothetical protein
VLSQLSKMLFLATFLPEAAEGSGVVSQVIRVVMAAADIGAFVIAFRYARGDPRGRVLGIALGWNFGEIVFRRVAFFWLGAWSAEFSWSFLCTALESNASLLLVFATVYFVDVWWTPKRGNKDVGSFQSQALYQAVALAAFFPLLAMYLGEWQALLVKFPVGGILAHHAAKQLNLY